MKAWLRTWRDRLRVLAMSASHALRARLLGTQSLQALRVPNLLLPAVIYIDPSRVEWSASVAVKPDRGNALFHPGDWDLAVRPMQDVEVQDPKYTTCRQLLEGLCPEATDEYQLIMQAVVQQGSYRGCSSAEDVQAHLQARKRFYQLMAEKGYKSQRELGGSAYAGEIQCALDREGRLIKINAGNHRFAAARQLGIARIPVHLCLIHDAHRESLEAAGGLAALRAFISEVEKRYGG